MQTSLFPTARPAPSGLAYLPDFIDRAEEALLLRAIDAQPWLSTLKRRVQHYGYAYDYSTKAITRAVSLGPLPDWLSRYAAVLRREELFAQTPNQVIVNEYRPGQGIAPHIDRAPCFAETVASLSLGSPCVMDFVHGDTAQTTSMLLEPCSLLVLSGDARYLWTHAIAPRRTDSIRRRGHCAPPPRIPDFSESPMSIKRLNTDERATYPLGLAVRRQLDERQFYPPQDPKTWKVISTIFRWAERWLTPAEVDDVTVGTGYIIRKELEDELLGRPSRPGRRLKLDKPPRKQCEPTDALGERARRFARPKDA